MAESLYRKYRPQVFEDVVGQDNITRTLRNAVRENRVSHAYLFCGPRGTGKTTTARLLAKALLCEHGPTDTPCGKCQACIDIANGVHPDVYELDAASRTGVDNVRDEIISRVNFAPTRGRKKVYIIDEVHMLTTAAFNALLKTLEEPPEHVIFILCTTDPQKVPQTIQSRCQRFDFHRISDDEIVQRLGYVCAKEKIEYEPEALGIIAQHAQGGMRNALTSLEQLSAFGEGHVTLKGAESMLGSIDVTDMSSIMEAIGTRDVAACFSWVDNYVEKGADLAQFADNLAWHVRDAYVLSLAGTDAAVDVDDAERAELVKEIQMFGPDRLARLLGVLGDLIEQLKTSTNPRLCFEIALTRMVRPECDLTLESLAERVEALERGQANAPASPAAAKPKTPENASAPSAQQMNQATQPGANARPQMHPQMPNARPQAPTAIPNARPQAPKGMPNGIPNVRPQASAMPSAQNNPAPTGPASSATPEQKAILQKTIDNPAALQRTWQEALAQIKKRKIPLAVMFMGVKVLPNQTHDGIVFQFQPNAEIAMNAVQNPENQEIILQELRKSFGEGITYTCRHATSQQAQAQPQTAPTRASAPMPNARPQVPTYPIPNAQPQAPTRMPNARPQSPAPAQPPQPQRPARMQPQPPQQMPQQGAQQRVPQQQTSQQEGAPHQAPRQQASQQTPQQQAAPHQVPQQPTPSRTQQSADNKSGSDSPSSPDEMGQLLSDAMGSNIVFHEVTDDNESSNNQNQ